MTCLRPLVILILILLMLPVVSGAGVGEDMVWAAKSVGSLAPEERLQYQDFSIRLHSIEQGKAVLAVYQDGSFKDISGYTPGQVREFNGYGVNLLAVDEKAGKALVAIVEHESRVMWSHVKGPTTLRWGDSMQVEGYTIKAHTFTDTANLLVTTPAGWQEDISLARGESEDIGDLRLHAVQLDPSGVLTLDVYRRGEPDLSVQFLTDQDVYNPDEKVPLEVVLTNRGTAGLNAAYITFSSKEAKGLGKKELVCPELAPGQTKTFEVGITPPVSLEETVLTVDGDVTWYDYYGDPHELTASRTVKITSSIVVHKHAQPTHAYMNDPDGIKINLTVRNLSEKPVTGAYLSDTVPSAFAKKDIAYPEWSVDLNVSESKNYTYTIAPTQTGSYTLPAAKIEWKGYTSTSESVNVEVNGPGIVMEKTITELDDADGRIRANVSLTIRNEGNMGADVSASDDLPPGASLLSGRTRWTGILDPGGEARIQYVVSVPEEMQYLPPATATYNDIRGNEGYAQSNDVPLHEGETTNIRSDINDMGPAGLTRFLLSSFAALLCIIGIVPAAAYAVLRVR